MVFVLPLPCEPLTKLNLLFRGAKTYQASHFSALNHLGVVVSHALEPGYWWRALRHDWPALARTQGTSRLV